MDDASHEDIYFPINDFTPSELVEPSFDIFEETMDIISSSEDSQRKESPGICNLI